MLADAQRAAMLAAMGIDVYRLRTAPTSGAPVRVGMDAQACVCVGDIDGASAERLFALLPAVLGVARERLRSEVAGADSLIEIDASAVRGDGQAKRTLWRALKPLARRLHEAD